MFRASRARKCNFSFFLDKWVKMISFFSYFFLEKTYSGGLFRKKNIHPHLSRLSLVNYTLIFRVGILSSRAMPNIFFCNLTRVESRMNFSFSTFFYKQSTLFFNIEDWFCTAMCKVSFFFSSLFLCDINKSIEVLNSLSLYIAAITAVVFSFLLFNQLSAHFKYFQAFQQDTETMCPPAGDAAVVAAPPTPTSNDKPKKKFQVVPVPGEFTRGRWKVIDTRFGSAMGGTSFHLHDEYFMIFIFFFFRIRKLPSRWRV